jgi:hypothetical protein
MEENVYGVFVENGMYLVAAFDDEDEATQYAQADLAISSATHGWNLRGR